MKLPVENYASKRWIFRGIGCCFLLLLGLFVPPAAKAELSSTNPPAQWLSLAELEQKWADVPLDALQRAADAGDLTAQHYLGYCYAEGLRFGQNPALAITYYERAAKAGYLPSWNNLGLLYQRGKIVKQDFAKAVYYYHLAADSGLAQAQANLGYVYRDGLGVECNPKEAMKWFQLAAKQGHSGAMLEIGRLYRFGNGVEKDLNAAETWFAKSSEKGNTLAKFNLGLLYEEEEGMPDKAISLFRQAADDGEAQAMTSLYFAYWNGKGVAPDHAEAVKWLTKAAEAGNAYAQCLLGYYYENPEWETSRERLVRLPPPNMPEAVRWYRRSADQGWAGGQYYLGLCYVAGDGVEQDEEHGLELVRQAADQNHAYAEFDLAGLYAKGIGEPRNEADRPIALLQRVVKSDPRDNYNTIRQAYDSLVFRYEYGIGTQRDIFTAIQWYCLGALAGMEGYSIEDKVEFRSAAHHAYASYHGDAGARLLLIAWPGISDHFLSALSQYLKAAVSTDHAGLMPIGEKYLNGQDVPQSAVNAWLWFSLAAENGVPNASQRISTVETRMTENELEEAKQRLPAFINEFNLVASALRGRQPTNFNTNP